MEVSRELNKQANEYISHYPNDQKRSASLPLLHLLQQEHGYINEESMNWVAEKLDIEPIHVLELVTFYPGLRQTAPGKYHIRVCRTLSCAMAGCYETMEKFCEVAGIDRSKVTHHNPIAVSEDGKFSIEFAECLASCGTGPVCLIGDEFYESVKVDNVAELIEKYD